MLHLDSHPELVLPNFSADLIFDKDVLLDSVSIADWILPAVYAGHLGCIVWIKPQWADQMQDGVYKLGVGKHLVNGQMRINLPLPYFIKRCLYAPTSELENIKTIPLYVFTLDHSTLHSTC